VCEVIYCIYNTCAHCAPHCHHVHVNVCLMTMKRCVGPLSAPQLPLRPLSMCPGCCWGFAALGSSQQSVNSQSTVSAVCSPLPATAVRSSVFHHPPVCCLCMCVLCVRAHVSVNACVCAVGVGLWTKGAGGDGIQVCCTTLRGNGQEKAFRSLRHEV
jgi:hypothetical protein